MKGVILAGGTGSRLMPCTKVTNKHLLPIYNKPMIFYPLFTLINAGIKEILIISGREHAGDFTNLLGSGQDFGVKLYYGVQEGAGGIAQALSLAEDFVNREKIVVILGDNIFEDNLKEYINEFEKQESGAKIFLKEVGTKAAKRFGIAVVKEGIVTHVEEKPEYPSSNLAMTGVYIFDSLIFDIIKTIKPSNRGELEITDAIDVYVKTGTCSYSILNGFWSDAGTFESLYRASSLIRKIEKPSEEENFWSDTSGFEKLAQVYGQTNDPLEMLQNMTQKQLDFLKQLMEQREKSF